MCREEWATIQHLGKSPEVREETRKIETILDDDGSGREWMITILKR